MQQQTENPTAATQSQGAGTGPGAEAITPSMVDLESLSQRDQCSVLVMLQIRRDRIAVVATLDMGGLHTVSRTWSAESPGIWNTRDQEFIQAEDRIGVELAEYLDGLELPFRVARMLPRPATAAGAAAMAEAAREVRHA